jgi:ribosomal protein S18 acetylase RimI-like enzyme
MDKEIKLEIQSEKKKENKKDINFEINLHRENLNIASIEKENKNLNTDIELKTFYYPSNLNLFDENSDQISFSNCESFKEIDFLEKSEDNLYTNSIKSKCKINNFEEEIIFSSTIDNNHFLKIKYCISTLFKITYPDDFFEKILNKTYFTITGSIKSFQVICFAIININYKKRIAEILSFGVLKEFQGKHYGTKLMRKINEELKSIGINEVKLVVQKINKIAISLYEKFGFRLVKEDPNYYKVLQGNERNALIMNKLLNIEEFWIFKVFRNITDKFF